MISYTCYFTMYVAYMIYRRPHQSASGALRILLRIFLSDVPSFHAELRKFMYKFMCPLYCCPCTVFIIFMLIWACVSEVDWWLDIIEKDLRLYNTAGKPSGFNSQTNPLTKLMRAQEWKIPSLTHKSCLFVQLSVLIWWKPADRTKGGAVISSEWLRIPQRHSSIVFMSTKCYDRVLFGRD